MVTSDFRPEVEIWPYRAYAMKNTQYNPYLMTESPKFLEFGYCGLGYGAEFIYFFQKTSALEASSCCCL